MEIVKFYRGERPTHAGETLDQILAYNNTELEFGHDWVQWVFPSNEMSQLNVDAPTLTEEESRVFESDPELQAKVKESFLRILDFFGFDLVQDDDQIVIETMDPTTTRTRPTNWLDTFNHNMLRMTRVLKALRLTGNERYAVALYEKLKQYRSRISQSTWTYWEDAATAPMWPAPDVRRILIEQSRS